MNCYNFCSLLPTPYSLLPIPFAIAFIITIQNYESNYSDEIIHSFEKSSLKTHPLTHPLRLASVDD
ncbi:MAG: hypothetical protein F6K50_36165 [Moorea sp. SIO3I7]|nr:hypothetical protein [Moorena sp. SIO3I7]